MLAALLLPALQGLHPPSGPACLRRLEVALEGELPLDGAGAALLPACTQLQRVTLSTASADAVAALPTGLTALDLAVLLPPELMGTEQGLHQLLGCNVALGRRVHRWPLAARHRAAAIACPQAHPDHSHNPTPTLLPAASPACQSFASAATPRLRAHCRCPLRPRACASCASSSRSWCCCPRPSGALPGGRGRAATWCPLVCGCPQVPCLAACTSLRACCVSCAAWRACCPAGWRGWTWWSSCHGPRRMRAPWATRRAGRRAVAAD